MLMDVADDDDDDGADASNDGEDGGYADDGIVKLSPDALTTCKPPPYAKYDDAVNQCS